MYARFLALAFVISGFAVVPHTIFGDGSGARQGGRPGADDRNSGRAAARDNGQARAPRRTTVASEGTAKGPTSKGARSGRSRAGRALPASAIPFVAVTDSNETGSSEPDVPPSPPTARPYAYSEPSSIQPLEPSELPPPARPSARGTLRLEVNPSTAQAYVDGFYVGTVDALNRSASGLSLTAGWHRLQFRAPGYETPAINVTVEPNRTTSYRGELKPMRP